MANVVVAKGSETTTTCDGKVNQLFVLALAFLAVLEWERLELECERLDSTPFWNALHLSHEIRRFRAPIRVFPVFGARCARIVEYSGTYRDILGRYRDNTGTFWDSAGSPGGFSPLASPCVSLS